MVHAQVAVEEHPLHQMFELRSLVGVTVSVGNA